MVAHRYSGFGLDLIGKYVAGIVVHSGSSRKNRHKFFIPALEIGHVIEKSTAFFVLVAGEILIAVSFVTKEAREIGPHGEYARSCLGVTLAFLLCWIYFDADACKVFVHAIRCVLSFLHLTSTNDTYTVDTGSPRLAGRSCTFLSAQGSSSLPPHRTK